MEVLFLSEQLHDEVISYHQSCLPEEGCGLLAGRGATVEIFLPVENILHSQNRYRMQPESQLEALKFFDEKRLDLIAIVHSHPDGQIKPSEIDIAEFAYPGVFSVIIAQVGCGLMMHCYKISDHSCEPVEIHLLQVT